MQYKFACQIQKTLFIDIEYVCAVYALWHYVAIVFIVNDKNAGRSSRGVNMYGIVYTSLKYYIPIHFGSTNMSYTWGFLITKCMIYCIRH